MDIILDTNIIKGGAYWMNGEDFLALERYAHRTKSKLLVPKVVKLELLKHYNDEVDKLDRDISKLSSLVLHNYQSPRKDLLVHKYSQFLDKRVETMEGSDVDIEKLLTNSVNAVKPFSDGGNGFKDALLWEYILCRLKSGNNAVFISNNSRDFGDGNLFDNLIADVKVSNANLKYYNSIAKFLSYDHPQEISFITDSSIQNYLNDNYDELSLGVTNYKTGSIPSELYDSYRDSWSSIPELIGLMLIDYYIYDEDISKFYVEVKADAEYGVEARVPYRQEGISSFNTVRNRTLLKLTVDKKSHKISAARSV